MHLDSTGRYELDALKYSIERSEFDEIFYFEVVSFIGIQKLLHLRINIVINYLLFNAKLIWES